MPHVLILAYGNPLRSDDGVAWHAAEALEGRFPPSEVEILRTHQLAPELAENVSHTRCTIFVDAAAAKDAGNGHAGQIEVQEIHSDGLSSAPPVSFSHSLSPDHMLGLASRLYGAVPRAFCVTMTGGNFDHGESLSPPVLAALPTLIAHIEQIVQSNLR